MLVFFYIHFYLQAWSTTDYMMRWAEVFCDMLDKECPGRHLLLLDELSCHTDPELKSFLLSRNVIPVMIPGGCTDVLQPVDMHFGAELKRITSQFYKVKSLYLR